MLTWIKQKLFGKSRPSSSTPDSVGTRFRARYDAAGNDPDNRAHWLAADSLSPNAATCADVRKTIRERARYEVANNSVAFGIANARVNDLVGTGPRLQLTLPEPEGATLQGVTSEDRIAERQQRQQDYELAARQIEEAWGAWCQAVNLPDTLRILERAKLVDGEAFALKITNPRLAHPVKLQLRPFEADLVTDPGWLPSGDPMVLDGIRYDGAGNPVHYTILREYPGDSYGASLAYDTVPAQDVYHFYRADRPGQLRGVSWLAPCLNLFAILRRYTLAVLGAAETAANVALWLKTDVPPDGEDAPTFRAMQEIDLPRRAALALPAGADIGGFKAEHPQTQFGDFRREVLNEIGRCLDLPLNVVSGNSSSYNFSSGRLDHLPYQRKLWVERESDLAPPLNRLFRDWLDEAVPVGLIPDGLPPFETWQWEWNWDGFDSIDPVKESQASEKLLSLNLTTLAEQCAARGLRWQEVLRQRKREQDYAAQIGLVSAPPVLQDPAPNPDDEEVPVEDER